MAARIGAVQLVFTAAGIAELRRGDRVVWSSADDLEFRDDYPEEMLGEADLDDVLDYLVDIGKLTEQQADAIEAYEESEEGEADGDEDEPLEGELEEGQ